MHLLACSGPDVTAIITRHLDYAAAQAEIVGTVLCASVIASLFGPRLGWLFPASLVCALLFHPLWTISPYHGDCGIRLADTAKFVSLVAIGVFGGQLIWLARRCIQSRTGNEGAP